MDLLDGDVELTEFEAIDVQSIKGVAQGANGFPILMMKGLAAPVAKGQRDCPKCEKKYDADHQGAKCENCGTDLPDADASKAAGDDGKCGTCKGTGKIMDGKRDCPDCDGPPKEASKALGIVVKAVTDGRIDQGPDIDLGRQIMSLLAQAIANEAAEIGAGSYGEVSDVELLTYAASMITRWVGHESAPDGGDSDLTLMQGVAGDWTPERVAAFKSAFKSAFPAAKPDTSSDVIAKDGADVDTGEQGTGSLSKAVEDAIAKAMTPLRERITALGAELAKVKAAPVPGGPVLSRNVQVKQPGAAVSEDKLAKAAYYREQAALWDSQDRATADGYRKLAREADAEAVKQTS